MNNNNLKNRCQHIYQSKNNQMMYEMNFTRLLHDSRERDQRTIFD